MSDTFTFTDAPPPPPTADGCIALAVGAFLADGSTPDGDGITYTVEQLDGWWDTPPVRSATQEAQPLGEFPTVNRANGRQITLTITAHLLGGQAPLGALLCFTGIAAVKAAFDALYVPVLMQVTDPNGTSLSTLVRLASPTRTSIIGRAVAARIQLTLIAPDPTLA